MNFSSTFFHIIPLYVCLQESTEDFMSLEVQHELDGYIIEYCTTQYFELIWMAPRGLTTAVN